MVNKIIITILILIAAGLLIGQRFGFTWAGGMGWVDHEETRIEEIVGTVTIDRAGTISEAQVEELASRGSVIRTNENSRARIHILNTSIEVLLDERTDLRLDYTNPNFVQLLLMRGRIVVNHQTDNSPLVVKTLHTATFSEKGTFSMVNYDFRQVIGVMPIETTVEISTSTETVLTQESWEIHEIEPVTLTPIEFKPDEGAAKKFYDWALNKPTKIPAY